MWAINNHNSHHHAGVQGNCMCKNKCYTHPVSSFALTFMSIMVTICCWIRDEEEQNRPPWVTTVFLSVTHEYIGGSHSGAGVILYPDDSDSTRTTWTIRLYVCLACRPSLTAQTSFNHQVNALILVPINDGDDAVKSFQLSTLALCSLTDKRVEAPKLVGSILVKG